jgi:hypothetical protein
MHNHFIFFSVVFNDNASWNHDWKYTEWTCWSLKLIELLRSISSLASHNGMLALTDTEPSSRTFLFLLFIYSHVHTLSGSHRYPALLPHSSPLSPSVPGRNLSLISLKKRHKHNKEDKPFLLVELRIAIQRDSYYCFCVPMC